jgi:hypothetical protein
VVFGCGQPRAQLTTVNREDYNAMVQTSLYNLYCNSLASRYVRGSW